MPKISSKTLKCYIFEKPRVQGHQNLYSQLSNTQIQIHKHSFVEVPGIPNICYISKQLLIQGCQKWYSQLSKVIRSEIQKSTSDFCIVPPGLFCYMLHICGNMNVKDGSDIWCLVKWNFNSVKNLESDVESDVWCLMKLILIQHNDVKHEQIA